jgi:putative ABC transport system permease protein
MQTGLTLAGLVVGTASIILVVSLGLTGRGYVMSQIEGVGSHLLWATYDGTRSAGVSRALEDNITERDVEAAAAREDFFSGVTPLVVLRGKVAVSSSARTLTVLGTTPNYPQVRKNLRMLSGRFLDDDDVRGRAKVCVVNRSLYQELFGREPSPEPSVRTLGMTFRVIGEFEEPVDTLGQGDVTPETIFIPVTVAWFFTPTRRVDTLFAQVRDFDRAPAAVSALEQLLSERHRPGSVYRVDSMRAVVRVARAISLGLLLVFILAAGISVVVGGVGIMNILLSSVDQRVREIGLRLSVGARRRDILGQFLLEALLLGIAGSLAGAAAGLGIPLLARLVVHRLIIRISFSSALFAVLFSSGVAVLFGVYPARRAASLNPTEALRHE